jgi:RNA polymerase sigma-70 factor (sigma-E family)
MTNVSGPAAEADNVRAGPPRLTSWSDEGRLVRDTFEEFVATRGSGLTRFAYVLCGQHHLAEDLVQEVLARMHKRWARIEREVDQPEVYVRRAVVREFLSWRRRRSSSEATVADVPEPTTGCGADSANDLAERDELWTALATLPRQQRAVLVLRYYEDLPDARIAEVLGCREVTVRGYALRGLARLRATLPAGSGSVMAG